MIHKDGIINICENYDVIVSYAYSEEDLITKILIDSYRDYIEVINLDSIDEIDMIYKYDQALAYYLDHYSFKKIVTDEYNIVKNGNSEVISNLIGLYDEYKIVFNTLENSPKWI